MQGTQYTIAAGDTLSGIAAKFNVPDYNTIAKANGITNPNLIRAGATITIPNGSSPTTSQSQPTTAPQSQQPQVQQPQSNTQQNRTVNPNDINSIIANYPGYATMDPNSVIADFAATKGAGKGGPSTGSVGINGVPGIGGAPTIDLNAITSAAYNTPEIQAAEKEISDRQTALNTAQAGINDNPFYSEATRVGKSEKLTQEANADIQVQQDQLASLKADAAIKVNAATGQYNIDNAAYQQKLSQFNSLVSAGGLDGVSANDLANYAAETGIPVSMLQSIQKISQQKDNPVSIVQSTNDQGNLSLIAVDSTGKVVNTTTVPGAATTKTPTGGATATKNDQTNQYASWVAEDAKNGADLKSLVDNYGQAGGLSIDQIYQIYNENSKYGQAKETLAQVKQGVFADQKSTSSTPTKKAFNLLDPSTW